MKLFEDFKELIDSAEKCSNPNFKKIWKKKLKDFKKNVSLLSPPEIKKFEGLYKKWMKNQ